MAYGKCRLCGERFTKKCPTHKICEFLQEKELKKRIKEMPTEILQQTLSDTKTPRPSNQPKPKPTKPKKEKPIKKELPPKYERLCKHCKTSFSTSIETHIYCSKECQKEYYKINHKIEKDSESTQNRFTILKRDKFRCVYCGKSSIENDSELHVDHIYPVSKGGADTADNLITSCAQCNVAKSNEILDLDILIRLKEEVCRRNAENNIANDTLIKWSSSAENRLR